MAHNISIETARKVLIDILKTLALPENSKKIQEAKSLSGKETIKFFQNVFPIVVQLQMDVVSKYNFHGREGLVAFEQIIREMESTDPEIARLRDQIRNSYYPPMGNANSPDVLI